jgi:heme/copper-type cytochrome/quinol oxidase subunit 1
MNRLRGRSVRRIRHREPFITSGSHPKPKSSFARSRSRAAAGSAAWCIICETRRRDPILGAKLFGIAAVVIAAVAFIPVKPAYAAFDFYMHDTYFVVAHGHAILGFALLLGVFAGLYYFIDRILERRLNNGVSLAHFLLWISVPILISIEEHALLRSVASGKDPNQSQLILAGSAAVVLAFLIGGLLFLVNFAWAIIRKVRIS